MNTLDLIVNKLREHGIQPTHQRTIILDYIMKVNGHPTADEINTALQNESPALSKATVYNTLHLLTKKGLIHTIATSDGENRYEIIGEEHGHFICNKCSTIYDIHISPEDIISEELDQFEIQEKHLLLKGICPKCKE